MQERVEYHSVILNNIEAALQWILRDRNKLNVAYASANLEE